MRVIFLCGVELVGGLLLGLGFFFPEFFHGILEILDFFSELILIIICNKLDLIFLFLNRMRKHIKFLPVLINTLIKRLLLNFIHNRRYIRLNILPHIKYLLKIFIQIIHLNMRQLYIFFLFLTQIMQMLVFHLGQYP